MKMTWLSSLPPFLLAGIGLVVLAFWVGDHSAHGLAERLPGMDGAPRSSSASEPNATQPVAAGLPQPGSGVPASISGSWPGFRGPNRDGICVEATRLARQWPADGPPRLWQITLGEGYAAAAIGDGCAYVLDYDASSQSDTMICLSLADGQTIWQNSYPVIVTRNHGMSRTIPAIAGDAVVTIGPRCHVACWDARTGECRWLVDMVEQFGAEERPWYAGQCPLIDGDLVIVAPGSPDALLVALDLASGQPQWQTPNPRSWKMTHSSIMSMQCGGQAMYIYCGTGGTAGVAPDDGRLLWDETSWVENFATAPSPVPLPDGRIFLSSGYDITGAAMLKLARHADGWEVATLFRLPRKQFNSEHQTPIYYDGHLYAVRKLRGGQLLCLDLDGKERWNSGSMKFGHGPYMIADGKIFALSDGGLLATMEATPDGFQPLSQYQVFEDGHDAWGPMAMVDGRLILRDLTRMVCLDVRQNSSTNGDE